MKKIIAIYLVGLFALSGFGAVAFSDFESLEDKPLYSTGDKESICTIITVGPYEIKNIEDGQEIFVDNFGRLSTPGEPNLPSKIFSIAIPPGAQFVKLHYENSEEIIVSGNNIICPITPSQLTGKDNYCTLDVDNQIFEENYNSIYCCDSSYPEDIVEFVRTSGYRKYNIVDVRVTPFTYNPLSGQLKYYPEVEVYIEYNIPLGNLNKMVDNSFKTEKIAREIILNYEQAKQWYLSNGYSSQGLYDFIIITLDSLESAVTSLIDWETQKGRSVKVVTSSWIDSNYEGYDLAEKMRNFLREKYPIEEWGIEDVLIVGHWDDIPMRLTSQQIDPNYNKPETDYYYAELSLPDSESWDIDGDHRYGENSDSIDFYAEVNVGRIPWSDPETVEHICEKSVLYEQNNESLYKKNILLLGAIVDKNTDGATFMEYKINEDTHPWMSSWLTTKMYELDSTYTKDYVLNHNNVVSAWSNSKFSFVSWHAHGSPTGSYANNRAFISVDDCPMLNDDYPAIISSASCSNSDTDYLNIGQAMMKQGAVGFLGANKASFYRSQWDDPNDGSDQSLKYFFTSAITSGEYTQGQAHQYALREMYSRGLWDRLYYETFVHGSLWGNPDIGILTIEISNPPEKPQKPSGPSTGKILEECSFSSSSIDPEDDDIYYKFDWDDGTNSGWIGPYESGEVVSASYIWNTKGTYSIKVKAKDINGAESDWSDPLPIRMPKNKLYINSVFLRLQENNLRMFPLLRLFLKLNMGV